MLALAPHGCRTLLLLPSGGVQQACSQLGLQVCLVITYGASGWACSCQGRAGRDAGEQRAGMGAGQSARASGLGTGQEGVQPPQHRCPATPLEHLQSTREQST